MSENEKTRPRLLLHVCCAPCSPHVVARLAETYDVTLYFYNPNIHPRAEYDARLDELRAWCRAAGLDLIVGDYADKKWFVATRGLEKEPERGARCEVCFDVRLGQTAYAAAVGDYDAFATVLTVSPHKDAVVINRVGVKHGELAEVTYLESDWKKKDGFKITTLLGRDLGFYRQDYCGCVYSKEERDARDGSPQEEKEEICG